MGTLNLGSNTSLNNLSGKSFNGRIVPAEILQFAKDFVEKNGKDAIPLLIDKNETLICHILGITL